MPHFCGKDVSLIVFYIHPLAPFALFCQRRRRVVIHGDHGWKATLHPDNKPNQLGPLIGFHICFSVVQIRLGCAKNRHWRIREMSIVG